jgi:hypothetical protein
MRLATGWWEIEMVDIANMLGEAEALAVVSKKYSLTEIQTAQVAILARRKGRCEPLYANASYIEVANAAAEELDLLSR